MDGIGSQGNKEAEGVVTAGGQYSLEKAAKGSVVLAPVDIELLSTLACLLSFPVVGPEKER